VFACVPLCQGPQSSIAWPESIPLVQRLDFNHEVYRVSKFQLHFAFRTFFSLMGCVQQREWQMWSAEISRRKISFLRN